MNGSGATKLAYRDLDAAVLLVLAIFAHALPFQVAIG